MTEFTRNFLKLSLIFALLFTTSSVVFSQTNYLISTGGTAYVSTGDKFYDAGGPSGNDGNTDYTMTLCPNNPGEVVVVDFTYFNTLWDFMWDEEDPLYIYDGATATGNDIGKLMGNYNVKYNTSVVPHAMGVEANGSFPLIATPTMFGATNSTGCLSFKFDNNKPAQYAGWEANIITYIPAGNPGCNIDIVADDDSICVGDPVVLTATGAVVSAPINNDFNGSTIGTGWAATSSATFTNNACGYPSLDGSIYVWMQNAASPRSLVTNSMDVSNGGAISFEYRQAINNGNSSPCECPDQNGGTFEGIYVQYSTNGGTTWTTFKYIYPNGTEGSFGAEGGLTGCGNYVKRWTKMQYPIPTAAYSANTKFRWIQSLATNSSTDNWGLDNVIISIPSPSNTITIQNLTTSAIIATAVNSSAVANVNPATTTTYRATVDDGTTSCYEDITIYVASPIVVSCGASTATSVSFSWTASAGATGYNYSYTVNGGAATNGNTASTNYTVNSLNSGDNVQLTVTPVNGICTQPVSCTCSTSGCATPTAEAGSPMQITCSSSSVVLDGTGSSTGAGYTYLWSTAGGNIVSGSNTLTPTVNQAGTYTITVTNTSGGCTAVDNVVVTQNITAPVTAITNNTGTTILTCNTTAISVTATGGGTYAWSGGATPGTAANNFTSAGSYTVTVTGANGCTATSNIVITQNITAPVAAITNNTGSTILTCTRTAISVTATGGGTYAWSGGATPGTAANSLTSVGSYTVTVTAANGCTASPNIVITQNITAPVAAITNNTGTAVLTCSTTSISVTATGGGTYAWSGGATPGTAANSLTSAGSYTVTVTGANGCTATSNIVITQNITPPVAAITNNTGSTILTCTRTAISVTATGGGTYAWSGGATPGTAANSLTAAGSYTVTVIGANGCTATSNIVITQNITPPIASITNNTGTTILTCSTTAISVTATGGGTYAWSGGATPGTAANSLTSASSYTVTVTAANGCTATANIVITQTVSPPAASITNNSGSTVLTCATTAISVTATGGGTYSWSGGATPGTAANSLTSAGSYTVTVTAANGCTATSNIVITQNITPPPATITNNTGTTVLTCSTTSISVTATGGGTYAWSGGATPGTAANSLTSAGSYTVTVTGANGCTATSNIVITQNITAPVAAITNNTGTAVLTCSTTSISVTANGGGTYAWSGGATPGTAANSFTAPGSYTVTVTGVNGCTSSSNIVLTQTISPPVAAITNNTGTTILTCNTTAISVTATGGGTYAWSGGATPGTAANSLTSAGSYTVTVTAANGCTASSNIIITQNTTPPVVVITNNTGTTVLTCNITNISVTATGGLTYAWSGGTTPGTAANSLTSAGSYTVTATAANGCTASSNIIITQNTTAPPAAITNNTGTTVLTCNTTAISVTATGGGTYAWSGGATPGTAANSLTSAGSYTVTVTGTNGCTASSNIVITQNITPPTAGITNNSGTSILTCTFTSISLTANGGGTYSWSGGSSTSSTSNNITVPALYTLTVTAANGCTDTEVINITQNVNIPTATITNNTGTTILTCNTTSILVTAGGGNTYTWSGGSTPNNLNNTITTPGSYIVTVTNASGCTDTETITITQNITTPIAIITNNTGTSELNCNVSSINATAIGGIFYSWNGGSSVNSANNTFITSGTYTVTVTGANGCTSVQSLILTQNIVPPTALITNLTGTSELNCNTSSINLTATGGGTYAWSGGSAPASSANTVNNPGTYFVTVTGTNGCTDTENIVITQNITMPVAMIQNNTGTNQLDCNTTSISLTANGGNVYSWNLGSNTGQSTNTITSAGTYIVTVTALNGCTDSESINISMVIPPTVSANVANAQCGVNGGSINSAISNGSQPYSITWSNTQTTQNISNLAPGAYTITVTDNDNCIATASAIVGISGNINASITQTSLISCSGENTGALLAQTSNGNSPVQYIWSNGSMNSSLNNLYANTYTTTITDNWGCTGTSSSTLINPMSMQINPNIIDISCNGDANGSIQISVSGGNSPYAYNWSNTQNSSNISGLSAGTYSVTVSDNINCSISQSFIIIEPTLLYLDELHTDVKCFGTATGSVTMTATGGTAPYMYTISNGVTNSTGRIHSNLPAGAYSLFVTDESGCYTQKEILLYEPAALETNYISSNPTCRENNNGYIDVIVSGGTAPYLFAWNDYVIDMNLISGLEQGTYTISITDANECEETINAISLTDNQVDCIQIPDAFTPNADGINDTWIIQGREIFPDAIISVYNRWGQLLYTARGDGEAWDGTYNDRFVPTGTYIFVVDLVRNAKNYNGAVTVIY